jgi:hypothetical protein
VRHTAPDPTEPDQGTPIDGLTGTIRDLPAGNQLGQIFVQEDGTQYHLTATTDSVWATIRQAKESGARVKIWGTLHHGVPASEARTLVVERIGIVGTPPPAPPASTVEGWTGSVVKLPAGNQFGQVFVRDDGQRYGISAIGDVGRTQIADAAWTGAQIKVWGTLQHGVPASEARHIEVERLEALAPLPVEPRYLSSFADVTASSHLAPDGYGTYHPYAAIDGARETAWVEGVDGAGVGEWIELRFPEIIELHVLNVSIGYDKSGDLFVKNNRVREAVLSVDDSREVTVTFEDSRGLQPISVGDVFGGPVETQSVRLTITDVVAGTRYDDTCIAEIEVYGVTRVH